uniref:Uncharacterized protein n=1 Tax=Caenorhabditis japonica TaxID=281687 RepID=A0A8R1HJJ3_CAEJA
MEDDDLYDMALGENYNCSAPSTSEPKTTEKVKEEPEKPPISAPDYAALFRELLVGSRAQIAELSKENERLQKNLENAISSGGVVICPNCTHHFKDRQCALRPRTMKKFLQRPRCPGYEIWAVPKFY